MTPSVPSQSAFSSVNKPESISLMKTLKFVIGDPLSDGKFHATFNEFPSIEVTILIGTSGINAHNRLKTSESSLKSN